MKRQDKQKSATGKPAIAILKLVLFLVVLIGVPVYILYRQQDLLQTFDSLESVNGFLEEYRSASALVYFGIQAVQILIFIIPGQAIQLAGGYVFGFWLGTLLTFGGMLLGTVVTFYLARFLGKDAIHFIIGKERTQKAVRRLQSKKGLLILFLIYLVPGIPKDAMTYAAGISDLDIRFFLLLSMAGRLPAMAGGVMIGSMLKTGSYLGVVLLSLAFVAAFITGFLFREKILGKKEQLYEKAILAQNGPKTKAGRRDPGREEGRRKRG